MLLPRILTALALLALLLPALLAASPWPFALLVAVLMACAGWEWSRLNGAPGAQALAYGAGLGLASVGLAGLGLVAQVPASVWWVTTVAWVLGAAVALRGGPAAWPQLPKAVRLGLGWWMLLAAWLAVAAARQRGLNFLLSAFCVVWMADVAAYAGGRLLGRRKLAPSISPGKSWEGVFSGVAGVLLLAFGWMAVERSVFGDDGSLFAMLRQRGHVAGLLAGLALLCGLSVVGDLIESLVKRAAGAKDSSRLLPGHGGVLDRIDAILPVLPAVMALASV
jgi:phosphatidate cytidylyltransferase